MLISTKGRYALRFMIDLAKNADGTFIPLKDIAERQDISIKYLERIALMLTQDNLLESSHGKGGGYRLSKAPEDYTLLQILQSTEGDLAPVACLQCTSQPCQRTSFCPTVDMWKQFGKAVEDFFGSRRLSDLSESEQPLDIRN